MKGLWIFIAFLLLAALLVATSPSAQETRRQFARQSRETDVPGFDVKGYTEFINAMSREYARQMSLDDEGNLTRLNSRMANYYTQNKVGRGQAAEEWTGVVLEMIQRMARWDNCFAAAFDGSTVSNFAAPKGERFLADLEDQPFIFKFDVPDSKKMYIFKIAKVDLGTLGEPTLRLDPAYPTLIKLFITGIREGKNSYPLTIVTPDGAVLYKTRFDLTGVKPGYIKIKLLDEDTGAPTQALMGLYPSNGRDMPPNPVPYYQMERQSYVRVAYGGMWPHPDMRVTITRGEFDMPVYPGPCRIVAMKGMEYRFVDETFDVPSGGVMDKAFTLKRFIDLRQFGWISSDDHCHIGVDPFRNADIMALLSAVDLRATNLVQMGDEGGLYFLHATWGEPSRYWDEGRLMMAGQEDPRTFERGHTLMYNIQNTIHDRDTYYLYEDAFKEARSQGGLGGYAHSASAFNAEVGATVSIPLGLVDFIELQSPDQVGTDVVYHFWNMGFRVPVFNGADYPYGQLPGGRQFYAYVDGDFTFDKYMESLKRGNTFTSYMGGFVDMRINGQLPNSIIEVEAGEPVEVTLRAGLNPDFDALDRAEIVKHGQVVQTIRAEKPADAVLEYKGTLKFDKSCWIVGRMYGKTSASSGERGETHRSAAHSSPFYIIVDEKPFWNEETLPQELAKANQSLDRMVALAETDSPQMKKQRDRLLDYVSQARAVYASMAKGAAPPLK